MENKAISRELTYQERQEMKELSKFFLGSSSKWQKLTRKGKLVQLKDDGGNPIQGHFKTELVDPAELLEHLRKAKALLDKQRDDQKKAHDTMRAAQMASGSAEGSL